MSELKEEYEAVVGNEDTLNGAVRKGMTMIELQINMGELLLGILKDDDLFGKNQGLFGTSSESSGRIKYQYTSRYNKIKPLRQKRIPVTFPNKKIVRYDKKCKPMSWSKLRKERKK